MIQAFKDNPRILCPVCKEHTFRRFGIDRHGNNREYKMCMTCKIENFEEQTSKYKEGYASQKDFDEANEK
jgi:hypothetical protein